MISLPVLLFSLFIETWWCGNVFGLSLLLILILWLGIVLLITVCIVVSHCYLLFSSDSLIQWCTLMVMTFCWYSDIRYSINLCWYVSHFDGMAMILLCHPLSDRWKWWALIHLLCDTVAVLSREALYIQCSIHFLLFWPGLKYSMIRLLLPSFCWCYYFSLFGRCIHCDITLMIQCIVIVLVGAFAWSQAIGDSSNDISIHSLLISPLFCYSLRVMMLLFHFLLIYSPVMTDIRWWPFH